MNEQLQDLTASVLGEQLERFIENLILSGRLEVEIDEYTCDTYLDTFDTADDCYYVLHLGTLRLANRAVKRLLFKGEIFEDEDLIKYQFLHEITHILVNELSRLGDANLLSLGQIVTNVQNSRPQKFFTGKASARAQDPEKFLWIFRRKPSIEAALDYTTVEEDVVELITMFLYSRTMFQDFLDFLFYREYRRFRNDLHIVELSAEATIALHSLVEAIANRIEQLS